MFDSVGTFGEWASATASLAGVGISLWALFVSRDAEKKSRLAAEKAAADSAKANEALQELERERHHIEQERIEREKELNSRNIAGSISAWWATRKLPEGDIQWGVILQNQGRVTGTARKIKVLVHLRDFDKAPIYLNILPPGNYFIPSMKDSNNQITRNWDRAESVTDLSPFNAVLNSPNHNVTKILFTDVVGTDWVWTPDNGLARPIED